MSVRALRLVLGDQLSFDLASLADLDPARDRVLLAEVAHNAPEGRVGSTTGGVLVYTFIGVIVGPSSFGSVYALTGHYGASFMIFALFGFAGCLIAWRAHTASR